MAQGHNRVPHVGSRDVVKNEYTLVHLMYIFYDKKTKTFLSKPNNMTQNLLQNTVSESEWFTGDAPN